MQCPVCDQVKLREVEREGVMIDVCPSCKGVWLDRGELEKLIQDSREFRHEYDHSRSYDDRYEERSERRRYDESRHIKYDKYGRPKKKRRMFDIFEDLFD